MRHILVMGVCGSGKSSIGKGLADGLGARFVEADELHPPSNIAHMAAGRPLSDDMRMGWLDAISGAVRDGTGRAVLACSALKKSYRDKLRGQIGDLLVIHLTGTPDLLAARMAARRDHFMPTSLLASQFADLEPPQDALSLHIDVAGPMDDVIRTARSFVAQQDACATR